MEIISFTQPNDNDKNLYIAKISKHFNDADLQVLKCCLGFRCLYSGAQLITILRLCLRFSKCLPLRRVAIVTCADSVAGIPVAWLFNCAGGGGGGRSPGGKNRGNFYLQSVTIINQTLSPSHHIATCVSRANRIVGLIKRTYENKSKRNIIALYKSLVRPHLEYCVATTQPKGHRQPGRSSEENDQDDQWNRRR